MMADSQADNANRFNAAGLAAQAAGDWQSAEAFYRQSISAAPQAGGHQNNLGTLLYSLGRLDEAYAAYSAALVDWKPLTRYNLGMTLLRLGDYARGWPLFEARRELPTATFTEADLPIPYWRGEMLAGKAIVLFPEQGLGDTIQFVRFALTLRDQGARVILTCQPALTLLLQTRLDGVEVMALDGEVQLGEPDYWALLGSLPNLLNLGEAVATAVPYLRALAPQTTAPARPRVGLVTRGSPKHGNDARRSLSTADAERLHGLPGVEIVSLHPEDSGDFMRTADLIAGLDLVVSVDSAIGHLAGAMGKRTLLLVPGFNTDWRWIDGRDDTPWYGEHRLIRSTIDGDWSGALEAVEAVVATLAQRP